MKKMMTYAVALFCLSTIVLTACGPVYETRYSYVSPATEQGRFCVTHCLQTRGMCKQDAAANQSMCQEREQQKAMFEYDRYRKEQHRKGEDVTRSLNSFDNSYFACRADTSSCEADYRACYQNCGGKVIAKTECVAFCDKAK